MLEIVVLLLIGLVTGFLASRIVMGQGNGILGDILIGIVGAFVGGFALNLAGGSSYGTGASILTGLLGAIVFLSIADLFHRSMGSGERVEKF
jgi:uncharacterized membrane protein YeaQ/YmgE (transglycosylase-associated protein family)